MTKTDSSAFDVQFPSMTYTQNIMDAYMTLDLYINTLGSRVVV